MMSWRPLALLALLLPTIAGCAKAPPPVVVTPVDYARFGSLGVAVPVIDVVEEYQAPGVAPHVEQTADEPPALLVRRWAERRFRPAGVGGSLRIVIKDAGIVEVALPRTGGLQGEFTTQQTRRYDGRLEIEVIGRAPQKRFTGFATATVSRSITASENISEAGRKSTVQELANRMLDALDAELSRSIGENLQPMIVY